MKFFFKKLLTNGRLSDKITPVAERNTSNAAKYGGIAQLGERLNGIQEVSGSIPLISTKHRSESFGVFLFCPKIEPLTSCILILSAAAGRRA